jgi:hypothetical protein
MKEPTLTERREALQRQHRAALTKRDNLTERFNQANQALQKAREVYDAACGAAALDEPDANPTEALRAVQHQEAVIHGLQPLLDAAIEECTRLNGEVNGLLAQENAAAWRVEYLRLDEECKKADAAHTEAQKQVVRLREVLRVAIEKRAAHHNSTPQGA